MVKRLPQYEWDTMRHTALLNAFQREADQLIYGIMAPAVYDRFRRPFGFPFEGWHNIVDIGILLHAKMMGLRERTNRGYSTFSAFYPVGKLVLMYSALLWQEIYQMLSLSGVYICETDHFSTVRSAFIFEGPKFLRKMCHGWTSASTDSKDATEMYRTAERLRHKRNCLGADEIEKNVKVWAKKGNIEESRPFETSELGRKAGRHCWNVYRSGNECIGGTYHGTAGSTSC